MKRRLLFIIFVFFALVFFTALVLVRPSLWTSQLLSYFNTQIDERYNLNITATRLSGNMLNNLTGEDVTVTTQQDSVLFTANSLTIQYSPWKILIGEFAIDEVHIDRPTIFYTEGVQVLVEQMQTPSSDIISTPKMGREQFIIERISIEEGQFIYHTSNNELDVNKVTGELRVEQGMEALEITGEFSSLQAVTPEQQIKSIEFLVHQYSDSLVFDQVRFMYDSASVALNGVVNYEEEPRLTADFQLSQISIGTVLNRLGIWFPHEDVWDISGTINTDFETYEVDTRFAGNLNALTEGSGEIRFNASRDRLEIASSNVKIGEGQLRVSGNFEQGIGGNASVQVEDLNLATFTETLPRTTLSGEITVDDSTGNVEAPSLDVNVSLTEAELEKYQFSQIQGGFSFAGDTLSVSDSLSVQFANAQFFATGWYALDGGLDALFRVETDRFDYLTDAFALPTVYGEALGNFRISGHLDNTSMMGSIALQNFGFRQFHFDTVVTFVNMEEVQNFKNGNLFIQARDGIAWGKDITFATLSAETGTDTLIIHNLEFSDGEDHLYLAGGISRELRGKVSTLELQYKNILVHNRTELPFGFTQEGLDISRGVIGINDGFITISGALQDQDSLQTEVDFTNIDLALLQDLVADTVYVPGMLNGTIGYRKVADKQALQSDIDITGVAWRDLAYNNVQILGDYYDGTLSLTKAGVETEDGGTTVLSGRIPLNIEQIIRGDSLRLSPRDVLKADILLERMTLDDYSPYIPVRQSMGGKVSGELHFAGPLEAPGWNFDLTVENPTYDKVSGKILHGQGRYSPEANRLEFTALDMTEANGGTYGGEGYLPMVNDFSKGIIQVPGTMPMDLHFWGDSDHFQFLEVYLSNVDAVRGDASVELSLTGTPRAPVRHGGLNLNNGTIQVPELENSINKVTLQASLQDNFMTIEEFNGFMYEAQEREVVEGAFQRFRTWFSNVFGTQRPTKKSNVNITGSLDFTQFFSPEMDLHLDGNDIYIRTLLSEIEGILDADLTVTGRDSIIIAGDLLPEETILRMDFSESEEESELDESTGDDIYVEYDLHSVFPGNLYIRNNQVNAELEGEVWILRHGSEPLNYSGSLNILRGRFYYYNDTFNIEEGQIFFDPTEFNPRVNIIASTEIGDQLITITLSGELDNPTIALDSGGGTSAPGEQLSEGEILSLLTFNSQEVEEQGLVAPEFQSIFTTYLERQLESYGSQLMGLETFELEAEGSNLQDLQDVSITVGQRVAPNLYLTYGRDFFTTDPTNKLGRMGLEYQLNRYVSFIGEVDEEGYYHFNYRLKYNY